MVTTLQAQFKMTIEAETDDDAVGFYRKCGFEVTAIQKYDVRRWTCVLPVKEYARKIIPVSKKNEKDWAT